MAAEEVKGGTSTSSNRLVPVTAPDLSSVLREGRGLTAAS